MSPHVVRVLIGRELEGQKAWLRNFSCHPVSKRVYPGIIPSEGKEVKVKGLLLMGLDQREIKILDYFEDEGVDYSRQQVSVEVMGSDIKLTRIPSQAYVWNCGGDKLDLGNRWDYEKFLTQHLDGYLVSNVCKFASIVCVLDHAISLTKISFTRQSKFFHIQVQSFTAKMGALSNE